MQSTFALIAGDDNGAKFGITYTLGNVIALCGCVNAVIVGDPGSVN